MTVVPPHAATLQYSTVHCGLRLCVLLCRVAYVRSTPTYDYESALAPQTPVRNEKTFCMSCATGWLWRVEPPVDSPVEHDGEVVMTACVYVYAVRWAA